MFAPFIFQLTSLSVSSGSDQLIVFHLTDGNTGFHGNI